MSINVKKLINLLKGKNNTIFWTLANGQHFVGNRMFVARFNKISHELLAFLLGVFLRSPNENETLKRVFGDVRKDTSLIDYSGVFIPDDAIVEGQITAFSKSIDDKQQAKIIDFGDSIALVNTLYTSLTEYRTVYSTGNSASPIYMANKDLLVMPIRIDSKAQKELVELITRFEYHLNLG